MNQPTTVLGNTQPARNSITLYGVREIKSGKVSDEGRIYASKPLEGQHVEYALIRDGLVANVGTSEDAVMLNDIEEYDSGKVLQSGYLYVGKGYSGEEVTIAVMPVDHEEPTEEANDAENTQTA